MDRAATVENSSNQPEEFMGMTEIQINAKILSTGRALERADWVNMDSEAAKKFCEIHARMGGCHDAEDLEKIVTGAMVFVMEGGSANHPGEALDQEEIHAETAQPLRYDELSKEQKEQVAAMFPASVDRGGADQHVYYLTASGQVMCRKTIAKYERELRAGKR